MPSIEEIVKNQRESISKQTKILNRLERLITKREIFAKKCKDLDSEALSLSESLISVPAKKSIKEVKKTKKKRKLFNNKQSLGNMIIDILDKSKKSMGVKPISAIIKNNGFKSIAKNFTSVVYQTCLTLSNNGIIEKIKDKNGKNVTFMYIG